MTDNTTESASLASRSAIVAFFETLRDELDDHNDRRERLIKVCRFSAAMVSARTHLSSTCIFCQNSRDVTNLSKKIIFLLHRLMTEDMPDSGDQSDHARALRAAGQGRERVKEVQQLFASIREEVQRDCFWRYQRNVSPGLQEYIEALSFAHYLETGRLVSFDEVQNSLSDEEGVRVRANLL